MSSGVPGLGTSWIINIFRVVFHPFVHLTYFYIDLCTRGQEKWQEIWHNFDLDLVPRNVACKRASTLEVPSKRDTQITQRGKILKGFIFIEENNERLRRKGVEVPVYYFFYEYFVGVDFFGVMFMWWRRVLISVVF